MKSIFEGLEAGDLKRLVVPLLEIDTYKSKMGNDKDICVVGMTVKRKEPAVDLVNFIEKGYDFVLDADCSTGEDDHGKYQVFIELERTPKLPNQIIEIIDDILNLTKQDIESWKFRYYRQLKSFDLTDTNLRHHLLLTSDEYEKTVEQDTDELNNMKAAAGLKITSEKPKDKETKELQAAAGII